MQGDEVSAQIWCENVAQRVNFEMNEQSHHIKGLRVSYHCPVFRYYRSVSDSIADFLQLNEIKRERGRLNRQPDKAVMQIKFLRRR